MLWLDAFEHFDPKTGEMPVYFDGFFDFIAARARKILENRSAEEIYAAYDDIEWMYSEKGPFALELFEDQGVSPDSFPEHYSSGLAQYSVAYDFLRMIMEHFDISEQQSIANPTWAEYFAIIALAKIAEAHIQIRGSFRHSEKLSHEKELRLQELCGFCLCEATDAAAIAEDFLRSEHKTKQTLSEIARKGGHQKNAPYNNLRRKIVHLYQAQYQHLSARQAAKKILSALSPSERSILRSDDPEKRLEIWIGQHKRSRSQGHFTETPN